MVGSKQRSSWLKWQTSKFNIAVLCWPFCVVYLLMISYRNISNTFKKLAAYVSLDHQKTHYHDLNPVYQFTNNENNGIQYLVCLVFIWQLELQKTDIQQDRVNAWLYALHWICSKYYFSNQKWWYQRRI